jgi:hypothetical protein
LVGAVLVLLSACGEDEERLIVEPADSPTEHSVTPTAPTPMETPSATPLITATVTSSATRTAGTPTPTRTPTPTATATPIDLEAFVGVYDVSFDAQFKASDAIAEVVRDGEEIRLDIWSDGHDFLDLHGTPTAGGQVVLEGLGGIPNDVLFVAEGSATITETAGRQQIHASSNLFFSSEQAPFVLDRPVGDMPSRYAGAYRFAFDPSPGGCQCATTATLVIAVHDDGHAMSTLAADETDGTGHRQGTFDPDECLVTARGRLRCVLSYETTFVPPPGEPPAEPRFPVTLMGMLTVHGTGAGRADAPVFPQVFFLGGDWTATRVGP